MKYPITESYLFHDSPSFDKGKFRNSGSFRFFWTGLNQTSEVRKLVCVEFEDICFDWVISQTFTCDVDIAEQKPGRQYSLAMVIPVDGARITLPAEEALNLSSSILLLPLDRTTTFSLTGSFFVVSFGHALCSRWARPLPSAHPLSACEGWGKVLGDYAKSADFSFVQRLENPYERRTVSDHLGSLLYMALGEASSISAAKIGTRGQESYVQMLAWIRANYANAEMDVTMIARHFSVSARYVHRIFSLLGEGVSFKRAVHHERMRAAERLLRQGKAIVTTAFLCGYTDAGYFSQVFKKAYGKSPARYVQDLVGSEAPQASRPAFGDLSN